ncbi:hypothetical protein LLG96_12930 [bacterium]|nr:hypothetical protein [bacterium]
MKRLMFSLLLVFSLMYGCQPQVQKNEMNENKEILSDATMIQFSKLFKIVESMQIEFNVIYNNANYKDENEKKNAKKWIKGKELYYEIIKIDFQYAMQNKNPSTYAWAISQADGFMTVPTSDFMRWENLKYIEYANLSRAESLNDDFFTYAISITKDINSEVELIL